MFAVTRTRTAVGLLAAAAVAAPSAVDATAPRAAALLGPLAAAGLLCFLGAAPRRDGERG